MISVSAVYQALVDSGIPISWATIFMGWRGVGSGTYGCKLFGQDVVAIAADRVGTGRVEQDQLLSLLANEDATDWQTIGRYLEELTEGEVYNEVWEARKWRLAQLRLQLDIGVKEALHTEYDPQLELAELFGDFWMSYNGLIDSGELHPDYGFGQSIDNLLYSHRMWADQEETTLKTAASGTPDAH